MARTVKEMAQGMKPGTYRIGFYNTADHRDDETEFTADTTEELDELFSDFCNENRCRADTVLYVEKSEGGD